MKEEIKITKEDLVMWLDRPPSDDDFDLCSFLAKSVENQKKYYEENKSLQSQLKAKEKAEKEFIKYLEDEIEHNTPKARWKHYNDDGFNDYDVENGDYLEAQPVNITLKEVISKYKEILSKGENK